MYISEDTLDRIIKEDVTTSMYFGRPLDISVKIEPV